MAEILTIVVSSLPQAMRAVLEVPHGRRDIVVRTVRVDHASAMRELLRIQTSGRGWVLTNACRLRELSIADGLLAIVEGVMLSVLINRPTDWRMLALLRRYAHRIKRCAGEVGGASSGPWSVSATTSSTTSIKVAECPAAAGRPGFWRMLRICRGGSPR